MAMVEKALKTKGEGSASPASAARTARRASSFVPPPAGSSPTPISTSPM